MSTSRVGSTEISAGASTIGAACSGAFGSSGVADSTTDAVVSAAGSDTTVGSGSTDGSVSAAGDSETIGCSGTFGSSGVTEGSAVSGMDSLGMFSSAEEIGFVATGASTGGSLDWTGSESVCSIKASSA